MEFYHVFSPQIVNGKFPLSSSLGVLYMFPDITGKKLEAFSYIMNDRENADIYFYHGMYRVEPATKYYSESYVFVKIDKAVKAAWDNAKLSKKFGI